MRNRIFNLLKSGVFDQHVIFSALYPEFKGHYARLRDMISEVKHDGVN